MIISSTFSDWSKISFQSREDLYLKIQLLKDRGATCWMSFDGWHFAKSFVGEENLEWQHLFVLYMYRN